MAGDAHGTLYTYRSVTRALPVVDEAEADESRRIAFAEAQQRIGQALGEIALNAIPQHRLQRLVIAGGETSGAVVQALGVTGLRIGPEIDPGVPWTETVNEPHMALALKSGNFGAPDFFMKSLAMLP